jgi:hypothetical protein
VTTCSPGTGARQSRENLRNRVLAPAVKRASEQLVEAGSPPLPDGLLLSAMVRRFEKKASSRTFR